MFGQMQYTLLDMGKQSKRTKRGKKVDMFD